MHHEASLKARRDYHSAISFAEKGPWREEKRKEGNGERNRKKQHEVIVNLISKSDFSDKQIVAVTGQA